MRQGRCSASPPRVHLLANGLQWCGLCTRILRHAVAHARHPVTGGAMAVTLPAGVDLRISIEESLEGGSDLRLAANGREYQHALASVYQVGEVPDVLGPADRPRYHVRHPSDAHHNHQFHADAAQRCPASRETQKAQIILGGYNRRDVSCLGARDLLPRNFEIA